MPVPPQLLLSHPEVKLPAPSIGVVTPCAAEPRFYHHRGAVGPTGVRAPAAGGRQAGTAAALARFGFTPQLFV